LSSPAANRRGIVAMMAAMTLFAGNDALLKLASGTLPPGQIMAVRGVFTVLLTTGVLVASKRFVQARFMMTPVVILRAALEASVAFLFITSVAVLPLANITAILQATPIIMTVTAAALGMEAVGWRRWTAVIVGFGGVILIVRPSPAGMDPYALIALATAALVAGRDFATRAIGAHVPSMVVTLSTSLGVCLAGILLALGEDWRRPGAEELWVLGAASVVVTAGNFAVITAFRDTEISVISPFRYANVPFSIVLGAAVFGDIPDLLASAGIALIVASGLYTLHREQVRRREAALAIGRNPAEARQ
jgi:drug/metabolite transporter (DMT)-like permease